MGHVKSGLFSLYSNGVKAEGFRRVRKAHQVRWRRHRAAIGVDTSDTHLLLLLLSRDRAVIPRALLHPSGEQGVRWLVRPPIWSTWAHATLHRLSLPGAVHMAWPR